jgi:chromosome segregation ATPase
MIRRSLVGGGVGLLALGLLLGQDATSYVRASLGWVQDSVQDQVPVEFQIERARKLIDDLEPEVRRNKQLIVREEVALERLAGQVVHLEQRQTRDKANLLTMQAAVQRGDAEIELAGHRYASDQVKRDMVSRLERYKTSDETLFNLRRVLNARQGSLQHARLELEKMLASRNQLQAEVQKLEARQQMVTVAQTSSEFNLDTSVLARAQELVRDVETRLDVTERLLSADANYAEAIPMDAEPSTRDVVDQVTEYFGRKQPQVESVASGPVESVPVE